VLRVGNLEFMSSSGIVELRSTLFSYIIVMACSIGTKSSTVSPLTQVLAVFRLGYFLRLILILFSFYRFVNGLTQESTEALPETTRVPMAVDSGVHLDWQVPMAVEGVLLDFKVLPFFLNA
jgi:hypothetical protein